MLHPPVRSVAARATGLGFGKPAVPKDLVAPKQAPVGGCRGGLSARRRRRPARCVACATHRMPPTAPPPRVPAVDKLEWKAPLEIVQYPDPRLRAVNARVACFDASLLQLARDMIDVMYQ